METYARALTFHCAREVKVRARVPRIKKNYYDTLHTHTIIVRIKKRAAAVAQTFCLRWWFTCNRCLSCEGSWSSPPLPPALAAE